MTWLRRADAADDPTAPAHVAIERGRLAARVAELGARLSADYAGAARPPVFVGVLKGSALFLADLARALTIDAAFDFIAISSYADSGPQSGVVRIVKDLDDDVAGRDVVVVEDIVDTGLTLNYLRRALSQRAPASLRAVALIDKSVRRIVPVELEYRGFDVPDVFVVGYGLDFQGRYRNVPDIVAVRDVARLANEPRLLVDALFAPRRGRDGADAPYS
ncbi:MAG TPA: hypoxanthine phosphoribosyltransferase [Actinomycetota bacterium]|nr:hypoxanthine phosphoribosyltransferase [Actinomycetota bacterium]